MDSKAHAVWKGSLKDGKGMVSTGSGVLSDAPYTFASRFEGAKGLTPEELIGAAHSGCFSMAFSAELGKAHITPESVSAEATVTLEMLDGGPTVTKSHLVCTVKAPGADKAAVEKAGADAKAGCPISRLLKAEVSLDLTVEV